MPSAPRMSVRLVWGMGGERSKKIKKANEVPDAELSTGFINSKEAQSPAVMLSPLHEHVSCIQPRASLRYRPGR